MPDTPDLKAIRERAASGETALAWDDRNDLLTHIDALTAAAREFFGGGRWQYHDEYAHVLLVDLDKLHDALLPDEEPYDA